jgi:hypothetical protein
MEQVICCATSLTEREWLGARLRTWKVLTGVQILLKT